jgi:hypothetical protein
MQITTEFVEGVLELRLEGRLDSDAAVDLTSAIDQLLRKGYHAALLDLLSDSSTLRPSAGPANRT